jgi:F-type H+-transporting ATPase subunit alpha
MVELLKQPQYAPFPVEEQVVSIWAAGNGYMDDVPVEDIRRFESEFLDNLRRNHAGILTTIRETKDLSDDTIGALKDAVGTFRDGFETHTGELLVKDEEVEALEAEGQETIARRVQPPAPKAVS